MDKYLKRYFFHIVDDLFCRFNFFYFVELYKNGILIEEKEGFLALTSTCFLNREVDAHLIDQDYYKLIQV